MKMWITSVKRYTTCAPRGLRWKTLTRASVGEDVEQMDCSYRAILLLKALCKLSWWLASFFRRNLHRQVTPFRGNSYLLGFLISIYLFGCTGSQLQHFRSLILATACMVFSFSLRNPVAWRGIELGYPELGMRRLSHWITSKVPWPLLVINPDAAPANLNCSQERALKLLLL